MKNERKVRMQAPLLKSKSARPPMITFENAAILVAFIAMLPISACEEVDEWAEEANEWQIVEVSSKIILDESKPSAKVYDYIYIDFEPFTLYDTQSAFDYLTARGCVEFTDEDGIARRYCVDKGSTKVNKGGNITLPYSHFLIRVERDKDLCFWVKTSVRKVYGSNENPTGNTQYCWNRGSSTVGGNWTTVNGSYNIGQQANVNGRDNHVAATFRWHFDWVSTYVEGILPLRNGSVTVDGSYWHLLPPFDQYPSWWSGHDRIRAQLSADLGNPNLYMSGEPILPGAVYDCRPFLAGTADEVCEWASPTETYIGVVNGSTTATSKYTLRIMPWDN